MDVSIDRVDPLDGRELLAHRNFVRSLARQLVRDAATAEDVTQEAMARLLEVKRPGSIRPWLRTVARNLARRFGRRERRRAEVEGGRAPVSALGASDESTTAPATDEIAARLELQRRLTERVLALEPRARDVVILHFYEGRTIAEVAAQLGVPLETARTRLRRALAELRAGWNGELGGEREGLAALALLAKWTPAKGLVAAAGAGTSGVMAAAGVTAMTIETNLASVPVLATAAALIVVTSGAFQLLRSGEPSKAPRAPSAASASASAPTSADASDGAGLVSSTLVVASQRGAETPPAPAIVPQGTLVLHVHYAGDHAAATGVTMRVGPYGGEIRIDVRRAATDGSGTVRFEGLAPGRQYVISDRADLGIRVEIGAGETTELDYEIPTGIALSGVVVDPTGAPVPDALVEVAPLAQSDFDAEVLATTDEEGRFDVRAAPICCLIGARAAGFTTSRMKFIAGKEGNEADVRLELGPAGGVVDGVVVGPDDKPVAATVILIGTGSTSGIVARQDGAPPLPAMVRSDAQGRFHAVGVGLGKQPVLARAAGLAPFRGECDVVAGEATKFDVTLAAGGTVHGVIRDTAGEVAPSTEVSVGDWNEFVHFRAFTSAEGTFDLVGLPIGTVRIDAKHEQLGKASCEVVTVAGSVIPCELRLTRGLELRGRVVDEKGIPVVNAPVTAIFEQRFAADSTDEEGRFALANCPESGTVTLSVNFGGSQDYQRDNVDPKAGEVEVVVQRGALPSARIVGIVVGPDGRPVANAHVSAIGTTPSATHQFWATGSDGRFDIGPFEPGTWRVMVYGTAYPNFTAAPHDVAANETCDVGTIALSAGGWAEVAVEGECTGVMLRVLDSAETFLSALDTEGGGPPLRTLPLAPGDYRLMVDGGRTAAQMVPFTISANVATPVELHLKPGVRQAVSITLQNDWITPTGVAIRVARSGELVLASAIFAHRDQPATDELWLAPGNYTITASSAGHEGHADFSVTDEEQAVVAIELK